MLGALADLRLTPALATWSIRKLYSSWQEKVSPIDARSESQLRYCAKTKTEAVDEFLAWQENSMMPMIWRCFIPQIALEENLWRLNIRLTLERNASHQATSYDWIVVLACVYPMAAAFCEPGYRYSPPKPVIDLRNHLARPDYNAQLINKSLPSFDLKVLKSSGVKAEVTTSTLYWVLLGTVNWQVWPSTR